MTCALRALTLCDGQVLEHPDRALTGCLCRAIARLDGAACDDLADAQREQLRRLIEKSMTAPSLPL